MTAPSFRESVRTLMRDRLLDAASDLAIERGWSQVTMAKIAEQVGVSRQTVYNELGTKPQLAEELVMRELERFLAVVRMRLLAHTDVVEGIRDACEGALTMGESHPLVRTMLSSVRGEGNDLLPLLTTESQEIIEAAKALILHILNTHYEPIGLTGPRLDWAVESIVRLVLSGITRPTKPAAEFAEGVAWFVDMVVRGAQDPAHRT